ncbi:MAG: DUF5916 domain-containing protein [Vicinamibacterales bacterium]
MHRIVRLAVLVCAWPCGSGAQPVSPTETAATVETALRTVAALRLETEERVALDGVLDETFWARAIPASNFVQLDPDNGQPATEPTEVRIVFTENALYLGVTCFDSEPDKWLGYQMLRDGTLGSDDRFMWTIDTFLDARTSYFFEMNPSGLMADALQGVGGANNRQWDGIWTGRARRSDIGWTLEIEIPFRTLNFNPDSDTWGINFQRTVRRKNEESLWMGWARNQGLRRMTNAGRVTGIRQVTQGLGLDVKPYLLGTSQTAPGRGDTRVRNDVDLGADVFYNVTPGLRATLTFNTDFAQAEVDQRQVNLTRFSLFFPEKRDFFLDGSLFFDFADGQSGGGGGGGPPVELTPFFSRRIGLGARGQPQPINFGAKVTGQVGAFDVGLLQVQTRADGSLSGEDFTVLRAKRRMLRQSYVGAIYTRRSARDAAVDDRQTVGLDFGLGTSTLMGSQNLQLSGFLLHATNPSASGRNNAFGLELDFPNDPWDAQMEYREVQENYDAAVGFTNRTGFRQYNPRLSFSPRPDDHPWIRSFSFEANMDWFVSPHSNTTLTREIEFTPFEIDLHSQDTVGFSVIPSYERLEEDFEISDGVTLPVGTDYHFTRYKVEGETANRRMVAVSPSIEWGSFYSGRRTEVAMELEIRVRPGLKFTAVSEWNRISLAEGRFSTRLFRGVAETLFGPWLSLVNNVQYDSQSAELGWQSRFRWILKPGNDLYLVYIHNWVDDPLERRFRTLDRRGSSKVLYTHRF